MIIDRYERPANEAVTYLSDPILQELDWILEDPELFRLVRSDLAKHYKRSRVGRPPVPVEVSLRMMVLRRRKQWSLRQTEQEVRDLWEPHTQIIRRGKPQPHETEFGHKINYAEVEHGLISDWQVCALGNPPDAEMLPPFLKQHGQRFGHTPQVLAGDRGLFSPDNETLARDLGVAEIAKPQTGERTPERIAYEKQDWFKKDQCFRNGIEGRISVVKRTVQLKRCLAHGSDGFERWIGMGILVANLVIIARLLHKRRHRKRKNVRFKREFSDANELEFFGRILFGDR
jgi:hypothetical protein